MQSDIELQFVNHQRKHSVSISMPPSPVAVQLTPKRVLFSGETIINYGNGPAAVKKSKKDAMFHSQPIPRGSTYEDAMRNMNVNANAAHHPSRRLKDKRYDSFKTWSGKLERQLTLLRGKSPRQTSSDENEVQGSGIENNISVDRYFAALEGPELETLRVCYLPPILNNILDTSLILCINLNFLIFQYLHIGTIEITCKYMVLLHLLKS